MSSRITRVVGQIALSACAGLALAIIAMACARAELPAQLASCHGSELVCDGRCVDPSADPLHCGACGRACAVGERCRAGGCDLSSCGRNLVVCDGECVQTLSDPRHCGGCEIACGAEAPYCDAGRCQANAPCFAEATLCGAECVSIGSDSRHCGSCFNQCPDGSSCSRGRCDVTCMPGLTTCGLDCVDVAFDPSHCGGCNANCESNEVCNQGRCQERSCEIGLQACGGECVDLAQDDNHCGQCFDRCESGTACVSGSCVCDAARVDCRGECVFTDSNSEHCGGCGLNCAVGQQCVGGECVASCGDSLVTCGDSCVNVNYDRNHCGACGLECGDGQRCVDGQCLASCDWELDAFPLVVDDNATAVGDLTLDLECNLYLGKQPGAVLRVDAATRDVTTLTTVDTYVRGIVFRPEDGLLYFSSQDRVHRMGLDGSDVVELENTNIGQHLNGMTMAPSGWGEFGGQLILARSDGLVVAIDPVAPVPTVIAQLTPFISDVEFDGGTLYVAAFSAQQVIEVEPNGQVTVFADAPCEPDGISVAPGSHLFAACGNTNELYAYAFSDESWTLVSEARLNGLFAPSGLLWDGTDTLIVLEEISDPIGSVLRGYDPL